MEAILEEVKRLREEQEQIKLTRLADQRRICDVESRMSIIDNVFNDLKTVEKESHFLLQPIDVEHYHHDDHTLYGAFKQCCCFFCL